MSPRATGGEAMSAAGAAERALSLPPIGNPFWSERAREEHALQLMRPQDLPGGDGREREGPRTVTVRSRSPVGDMSGRPKPRRNRSGSSEGEPKNSTKRGKGVGGDVGRREDEVSLERLLERELVDTLKDENEKLREELRRLRRSGTSSLGSWSDVTPQPPSDPPPKTPERTPPMMTPMSPSKRYTPNGTEVPAGPPPGWESCEPAWIGQIPRWPESLGAFEAKDLMGRHEGQVKRVSERPGQDLGDGECLDDRALHGMRDGLQRGHRAFNCAR